MKTSTNVISLTQSQALNFLESQSLQAKSDNSWASIFSYLISSSDLIGHLSSDPLSSDKLFQAQLSSSSKSSRVNQNNDTNENGSVNGLSFSGRNMALPDPESAYKMMTFINNEDVLYKAQFSELNQVEACVTKMQDAGQSLGRTALSTGNDSIKTGLQDFVGQYNNWIQRIEPDIQPGGLLADTQAAQVSQYELEQNLKNRFFGCKDGVHGLRDLGISIDPQTRLLSLDTAQLDKLLANNKPGVIDTVQEFSESFAKSASLLNSENNFIPRQLDNLNRAIHFISDNKASMQAEFGTGNAAKPVGQVAEALAAYNRAY
jgi:hypothetical protein